MRRTHDPGKDVVLSPCRLWLCLASHRKPPDRALRSRHLQLIAAVEAPGSLSRAADVLSLRQPVLSKALEELEDRLGFAVFHRGPRGLRKTPQGAIVVRGASLLLREMRHVHAEAAGAAGAAAAVLRLGTSAFIAVSRLPPVIARLTHLVPPVAVQLREDSVPRLFGALLGGDLDARVNVHNPDVMATRAEGGCASRSSPKSTTA